jgi:hypothetical protein
MCTMCVIISVPVGRLVAASGPQPKWTSSATSDEGNIGMYVHVIQLICLMGTRGDLVWSRLALSDGNQWASVGECSSRPHVVTRPWYMWCFLFTTRQ